VSLAAADAGRADVYMHRDADGVVHLSNVPSEALARRVLHERPRMDAALSPLPPTTQPPFAIRSRLYDELIADVAAREEVEFALVKAVMHAESAFDPLAVSSKGALGLMQLMPATARMHGVRDVFTPEDNIEGGVRHLRMLLDRYAGNVVLAVAAYNAGSTRVDSAGHVPMIPETREYVARVIRFRAGYVREGAAVNGR